MIQYIQNNSSTLSIHADGTADIDGVEIDSNSIGLFIRQFSVEKIENSYLDKDTEEEEETV